MYSVPAPSRPRVPRKTGRIVLIRNGQLTRTARAPGGPPQRAAARTMGRN